jgi:hypothetical protein
MPKPDQDQVGASSSGLPDEPNPIAGSAEPAATQGERQNSPLAEQELSQDDLIAALASATPIDTNFDLVLDHLTTSTDLFGAPQLDFSTPGNDGGSDQG